MASAARSDRLPTMSEWWYVPAVSRSSRRSSGCDGVASSSNWNEGGKPKRLPRTPPPPGRPRPAPRQPAEDDVDAQLDRAHDDGGEHADDRGQDDRRPGVEEDGGEQARRGAGHDEGHDRAVGGELQAERRPDGEGA